ncbi:hypothetical protein P175DRAFT_0436786 [Aspergillus ochraceoroseus IBT 24754]|uniref:Neutral protease 2 n=1 Tax=Aspergillus ochraceoroseus IBT 24754 TaxID=1392256 RepID=A0A2T5LWH2_9EURO|nr:uncharacterized protein P175DRAFT_0436786 [Aspergillus ochraceoroseus IBT 24754]PTU20627.1 hypothetical protein P175DRAFT_0436786 [Aspergillus ochraceoroseus IBT 24754]
MVHFSFFHLLAFFTLASGKPILIPRLAQDVSQGGTQGLFSVSLESLGSTSVKAQVTNVGTNAVRLVQRGGILDQLPTRKVSLKGTGSDPTFAGVQVKYVLSHLSPEAFVRLSPNQTVESIFDITDIYPDLSPNQEYTAAAEGTLEYTTLDNPRKFSHAHYTSNSISVQTPKELAKRLEIRSTLECTGEYNQLVQNALKRAASMATAASADARSGSANFEKFFKSTNQDDRDEVADRLEAIAREATTTGELTYYCEPTALDYCGGNIAAMTYPTENKVVNCPGYYETPAENNYCNYLDQAAISLHEFAHATAVYSPGTEDITYGYESVLQLSTSLAKNNADSFAYYASGRTE